MWPESRLEHHLRHERLIKVQKVFATRTAAYLAYLFFFPRQAMVAQA